jgi:uncharacterized membrane protein YraQ (UPF0718 family)
MKKNGKMKWIIFCTFLIALIATFAASYILDISWGKEAGRYFGTNFWEMVQIVPAAFVLIALFDKWIKREHVIAQLGASSGIKGYLWALLLAGISVGGVYVMFPLAASLSKKGASHKIVFAYLGFAGVCRIPMVMFEITFLGLLFTVTRLLVAIPLLGLTGFFLGKYLDKQKYELNQPSE